MRALVVYESMYGNTQRIAEAIAEGLRAGSSDDDPRHDTDQGQRPAAATFDTATRTRWFPTGSTAKPAARRLAKHGYRLIANPEHFYVEGQTGPLIAGELERARAWGAALVSTLKPA